MPAAAPTSPSPASLPPPRAAAGYELVCPAAELAARGLRQHTLRAGQPDAAALCIVSSGGALAAMSDVCPHKQGALHLGDIEDAAPGGLCVRCPRHRKKYPGGLHFYASTGASYVVDAAACTAPLTDAGGAPWAVDVHDVIVADGWVQVAAAPRRTAAAPRRPPPPSAWTRAVVASIAPVGDDAWELMLTREGGGDGDGAGVGARGLPLEGLPSDTPSWHVSLALAPPAEEREGEGEGESKGEVKGEGAGASAAPAPVLSREYTPLTPLSDWDARAPEPRLGLLLRAYAAGALSPRLAALRSGDAVWVSAAEVTLAVPALRPPRGSGQAPVAPGEPLGLIAGGTGVAPILQLARWAVAGGGRDVHVLLSSTASPALGEAQLRALAAAHPRLRVLLTTTGPSGASAGAGGGGGGGGGSDNASSATHDGNWATSRGRIDVRMLAAFLPPRLARVVVSGPAAMNAAVALALAAAGHAPESIVELDA